jgi:uroporphyrinogen decarboxylase
MRTELTPRERVTLALNHEEPDRLPVDVSYTFEPYVALRNELSLPTQTIRPDERSRVTETLDLVQLLGTDFLRVGLNPSSAARSFSFFKDTEYTDAFGIHYLKVKRYDGGVQFEMTQNYPLKEPTLDALEAFQWPDPHDPFLYEGLQERTRHIYANTNYAIHGRLGESIFERAGYMRGLENWMMDLLLHPDFVTALLQKLADIQLVMHLKGLDLIGPYISTLRLGGEDLGSQQGPMISPRTFRTIVKPILADHYSKVKEKYLNLNPDGKLMLHSCGAVREFIPDFIDMGIDVLDPIQTTAKGMNGLELKTEFGNQIAFHGGIDTQRVLPFGSLDDVEMDVRSKIEMFAPGGGYILGPTHNAMADVPAKNIIHMVNVAKKWGRYPITWTYADSELLGGKNAV